MTINPSDLHDPIAQIFVRKKINLDDFIHTQGPNKETQVQNIAGNPYAASYFFYFIIKNMLRTLFGVMFNPISGPFFNGCSWTSGGLPLSQGTPLSNSRSNGGTLGFSLTANLLLQNMYTFTLLSLTQPVEYAYASQFHKVCQS